MEESVLSVGGIAPPTTSPKSPSRKASKANTGLQFDALLRDEIQPKPNPESNLVKEEPKPDKCQKVTQDNISQPLKDELVINPPLCNPAPVNVPTIPETNPLVSDQNGTNNEQSGNQVVAPVVVSADAGAGIAKNPTVDLSGNLVAAAKEALPSKSQNGTVKEGQAADLQAKPDQPAKSQDGTVKAASTGDTQTKPDQPPKSQVQSSFVDLLDQVNPGGQAASEPRQVPKTAAAPTASVATTVTPGPDLSGQLSVQTAQKPTEEHPSQAASSGGNAANNFKKDGQEANVKTENTPPITSGLEKTGLAEANKNIEPARLAEARTPHLMSQILDGLETLVKNKNVMMRMQLYPDELGHIELKVVSNAQGLGVFLRADQPMTQQLLESQLSLLRQTLSSAGLNPAHIDVGLGNANRSFNTRDPRRSPHKILKDASRQGSGMTNEIEIPILGRNFADNGLDYKI